jgi:hypothetical protein
MARQSAGILLGPLLYCPAKLSHGASFWLSCSMLEVDTRGFGTVQLIRVSGIRSPTRHNSTGMPNFLADPEEI